MRTLRLLTGFLLVFTVGCKNDDDGGTEKFQNHRDKIINVEEKIIDIHSDILFGISDLYVIDSILILNEIKPGQSKGIHLFNKNTFEYITSTGVLGRGPGEITRPGRLGVDAKNRVLWAPDHGKKVLFKFPLDSVLNNEIFKPTTKMELHDKLFIERYGFVNDSIAIGKAVRLISHSPFEMTMARLNLNNNKTEEFGYEHPKAIGKKSRSFFKLSTKGDFYVSCYVHCDLMTICDVEGNLKYNIYGPGWLNNEKNRIDYYSGVDLLNNHIIASYLGAIGVIRDESNRPQVVYPTKFLVFDKDGNYKATIETEHKILFFCADEKNNRVICYFDDRKNPLGYFDFPEI